MDKPNRIRILVVRPGDVPVVEEIANDLQEMKRLLDCQWLEVVHIGGGYHAWLDEDGIYNKKPQNGCGFLGTYLFARSDEEGNAKGLDEKQVQECLNYWNKYKHVQHSMSTQMEAIQFNNVKELMDFMKEYHEERERLFKEAQKC